MMEKKIMYGRMRPQKDNEKKEKFKEKINSIKNKDKKLDAIIEYLIDEK